MAPLAKIKKKRDANSWKTLWTIVLKSSSIHSDILEIDLSSDDWLEKSELARSILFKQAKVQLQTKKAKELKEKAEYDRTPKNFYRLVHTNIIHLLRCKSVVKYQSWILDNWDSAKPQSKRIFNENLLWFHAVNSPNHMSNNQAIRGGWGMRR